MKHEPHAKNNNKVQSGHETRELINSKTQNEQNQTPVIHKHQHEIVPTHKIKLQLHTKTKYAKSNTNHMDNTIETSATRTHLSRSMNRNTQGVKNVSVI